jgi:hypothetical protein
MNRALWLVVLVVAVASVAALAGSTRLSSAVAAEPTPRAPAE